MADIQGVTVHKVNSRSYDWIAEVKVRGTYAGALTKINDTSTDKHPIKAYGLPKGRPARVGHFYPSAHGSKAAAKRAAAQAVARAAGY